MHNILHVKICCVSLPVLVYVYSRGAYIHSLAHTCSPYPKEHLFAAVATTWCYRPLVIAGEAYVQDLLGATANAPKVGSLFPFPPSA